MITSLGDNIELRARKPTIEPGPTLLPHRVHWEDSDSTPRPKLWPQQAKRILEFQQRWERIRTDLPPQLSRKHSEYLISVRVILALGILTACMSVGMISIGTSHSPEVAASFVLVARMSPLIFSAGGVIGTGLFVGSAVRVPVELRPITAMRLVDDESYCYILTFQDALRSGGPVGAFLGYLMVGSVVYCLCVSLGEMIAY